MVQKIQKSGIEKKEQNIRNPLPVRYPPGALTAKSIIDQETLRRQKRKHPLKSKSISAQLEELSGIERAVKLCIQDEFQTVTHVLHEIARSRRILEELLQASYGITSDQLDAAHEEQKKSGEKLGDVLVRLGFLNQPELDAALSSQFPLDDGVAPRRPSWLSLGQLLIHAGYTKHEHVKDALARQRVTGKKLGEVLVEAGHVQQHHIEHGLHIQKHLFEALLITALSIVPTEEAVSSTKSTQVMSTNIQVTAMVSARSSIKVLRQPSQIIITEADIQRGFLDAKIFTLVEIKNNTRTGVDLIFETGNIDNLPFKEVLVGGLGKEVALKPSGGIIACQITGTRIMELSYRFILDKSSQAGTYAWPFSLSANPVK